MKSSLHFRVLARFCVVTCLALCFTNGLGQEQTGDDPILNGKGMKFTFALCVFVAPYEELHF